MSIRLFEGRKHANLYVKYRATVPDSVIKRVLDYLGHKIDSTDWNNAVDVGCGSGQATNRIAQYFKHCYGLDVSPAQIKMAKEAIYPHNISYEVSPAENMPSIPTNSIQLVTAVQAVHWFDFEKFMIEMSRVLVTNGVVAIIGFSYPDTRDPRNTDDERITHMINELLFSDQRLIPYRNPHHIRNLQTTLHENLYRNLQFPDNYEIQYIDDIKMSTTVPAQHVVGRFESSSQYQTIVKNDPNTAQQILQQLRHKLQEILEINDLSNIQVINNYHCFIALARKLSN
ncbi:putative methyltransferase DDB_G0268948 [Oppia nitens]|uniref:putative methyltransferase DDB_G0268948 n=1 Tax=Oppia nitens TaxID=1686743 RepID=UPI0023DBBF7A|nr:putative methyltransferase DDB_G0268948 [Oppia nitens]